VKGELSMGRAQVRCGFGHRPSPAAGGVAVRVLLICLSLAAIVGAVLWLLSFQQKNEERYSRKAMEISEYGLLHVLEKLGQSPSWRAGFSKTAYEGGWYCAKAVLRSKGDTVLLSVESIGHIGTVSKKQECLLKLSIVNGDSVWNKSEAP